MVITPLHLGFFTSIIQYQPVSRMFFIAQEMFPGNATITIAFNERYFQKGQENSGIS